MSGSAINATVDGGLAYPSVLKNGTVEDAEIILYGTTTDKVSYLIQISGIGTLKGQVARIVSTCNTPGFNYLQRLT